MKKLLFYCTKSNDFLLDLDCNKKWFCWNKKAHHYPFRYCKDFTPMFNGKIVAECDCNFIEKFDIPYPAYFYQVENRLSHIKEKSCLSFMNLHHYLKNETGYALHLSNLKIFDKPHYLNDLFLLGNNGNVHVLEKAPQNMCNVSFRFGGLHSYDEEVATTYILISIRPEHLVKILNGEKTIEVRKRILKCLKELIA